MALGAQRWNVLWLILRDVGMLAGLGVGLGAAAAVASARLVASMLYGIAPGDTPTVAASAVVLLASAALAGYIPARRAALVEPTAVCAGSDARILDRGGKCAQDMTEKEQFS